MRRIMLREGEVEFMIGWSRVECTGEKSLDGRLYAFVGALTVDAATGERRFACRVFTPTGRRARGAVCRSFTTAIEHALTTLVDVHPARLAWIVLDWLRSCECADAIATRHLLDSLDELIRTSAESTKDLARQWTATIGDYERRSARRRAAIESLKSCGPHGRETVGTLLAQELDFSADRLDAVLQQVRAIAA